MTAIFHPHPDTVLPTRRLRLTIGKAKHCANFADYLTRNRRFHAPWSPRRPREYYQGAYWERQFAAKAGQNLNFLLFLADTDLLVGQCTLSNIARGPFQAAYLGFSLDKEAQGKGYMQEALRELIAYSFEQLHLHRLMANYLPYNRPSAKLLHLLGFRKEGLARDYLFIDGQWRDHILSSLTNPMPCKALS